MNYYDEIKNKLLENETYERIKNYSKDRHRVNTYFEVGRILLSAGSHYGEDIIGCYAEKLVNEVGKKYNKSTLFKMRKFFEYCSNQKVAPLVPQLSWSHWLLLIPLKEEVKIIYYANQCMLYNLSKRELQSIIKCKEFERIDKSIIEKTVNQNEIEIQDFIKNPIVIHSKNITPKVTEKDLQNIILENIPDFLKELGGKFSFIGNEYKIKIGDRYNYIDLLLYNYQFHCFAVVELKVTELKKEHIGQIEMYMNYIDRNIKTLEEDNTIGIVVCKRDNHFVMEYCSDSRVFSREYKIIEKN